MSNAKQKTRMKPGTIAIIALSFVLVLSLITTITLAYFTATRNVTTTIKFADGVTLQMVGVKYNATANGHTENTVDVPERTPTPPLYWVANIASGGTLTNPTNSVYGGYSDVNDQLTFEDMKVRTVDSSAYVAVKYSVSAVKNSDSSTVTLAGITGYTAPTLTSEWMTTDTNGWHPYQGNGSTSIAMPNEFITSSNYSAQGNENTGYHSIFGANYQLPNDAQYIDNFAGITITITVQIVASDTANGLTALMV